MSRSGELGQTRCQRLPEESSTYYIVMQRESNKNRSNDQRISGCKTLDPLIRGFICCLWPSKVNDGHLSEGRGGFQNCHSVISGIGDEHPTPL
jgi:hypothetical protein